MKVKSEYGKILCKKCSKLLFKVKFPYGIEVEGVLKRVDSFQDIELKCPKCKFLNKIQL